MISCAIKTGNGCHFGNKAYSLAEVAKLKFNHEGVFVYTVSNKHFGTFFVYIEVYDFY